MISFISSAKTLDSYPDTMSEVVFVGRSNVGKSSLINALYGNVAYVGKTPGKTKLLNFFNVDNKYTVCDVPGYGFAKLSDSEIIDFGDMMEEYFSNRSNLKLCVMILDVRRIPNDDDLSMNEYCEYYKIPCLYVLNKIDKLSNNRMRNQIELISEKLAIEKDKLISVSAINSTNINQLKSIIESSLC